MHSFDDVLQALSRDPGTRERVQSELRAASDPPARFIELAREHGLSIDRAELERAVAAKSRELNEAEMEAVSGGTAPGPPNQEQLFIGLLYPALMTTTTYRY